MSRYTPWKFWCRTSPPPPLCVGRCRTEIWVSEKVSRYTGVGRSYSCGCRATLCKTKVAILIPSILMPFWVLLKRHPSGHQNKQVPKCLTWDIAVRPFYANQNSELSFAKNLALYRIGKQPLKQNRAKIHRKYRNPIFLFFAYFLPILRGCCVFLSCRGSSLSQTEFPYYSREKRPELRRKRDLDEPHPNRYGPSSSLSNSI